MIATPVAIIMVTLLAKRLLRLLSFNRSRESWLVMMLRTFEAVRSDVILALCLLWVGIIWIQQPLSVYHFLGSLASVVAVRLVLSIVFDEGAEEGVMQGTYSYRGEHSHDLSMADAQAEDQQAHSKSSEEPRREL